MFGDYDSFGIYEPSTAYKRQWQLNEARPYSYYDVKRYNHASSTRHLPDRSHVNAPDKGISPGRTSIAYL